MVSTVRDELLFSLVELAELVVDMRDCVTSLQLAGDWWLSYSVTHTQLSPSPGGLVSSAEHTTVTPEKRGLNTLLFV